MAKKIEIIYDINGKAIDVAIDKTLNLQQQAKALTAELRRTKEGTDEFRLLSKQLGDAQDGLAKTTAKSKDLFSSLSMLPGPVGDFFASLTGSIEVLKTFSSFTLKDLRFQLGETASDVADIGENLLGLNEVQASNTAVTEAEVAAVEQLAVAEAEATVSTEAHVAVVEAETVATEAAEVATIGLGAALKAIGIGFLLAGLAALVLYWDKISDAITGATDKSRTYNDAQKQVTKDLTDFNVKLFEVKNSLDAAKKGTISKKEALKDYNDKLGKTVGYAGSLEQAESLMAANTATVIESIKLRAQAQIFYGKSAEAAAKLVSGEALELTFWDQAFNAIKTAGDPIKGLNANLNSLVDNVNKTQKTVTDFAAEGDKLTQAAIDNDKKLKKGLAEAPKDESKKENQDKELLEKAQKLQEDLTAVQKEAGQKREKQEIQNAADAEIREIKKLNISAEYEQKRQDAIADVQKIANKKKREIDEKYAEEEKKKNEEALKATEDFNRKVAEIRAAAIKDETDRAITERQQKLTNELSDLEKDKEFIKKSEAEKIEIRKNLTTAAENDINKIKFDAQMKGYQDELTLLEAQQKALQVGTQAYIDNSIAIENQAYAIKLANAKDNAKQIEAINLEHTQNLKNIDLAAFEAKKQIEIEKYQVIAGIGASLQQLAGKNKALAIGGIVIEKAAAIGQIVANTQIANAKSVAASPLTFGQPWVTINTIAGVLSGAATIAAAAKAISEINGQSSGSGSSGTSGPGQNSVQSLGRNYGDGGMIDGPRHAAGGVLINAEGGEAVMTRGAVTMFAPLLSTLNQMGGGTSFNKTLQGASYDTPKQSNDNNQMIVKTYVVENELTSIQHRQARLKDLSTL